MDNPLNSGPRRDTGAFDTSISSYAFMPFAKPGYSAPSRDFMPFGVQPDASQDDFEAADDQVLEAVMGEEKFPLVNIDVAPAVINPQSKRQAPLIDPNPTRVTEYREVLEIRPVRKEESSPVLSKPLIGRSKEPAKEDVKLPVAPQEVKAEARTPKAADAGRPCTHAGPKHPYTCPVPCSLCTQCLKQLVSLQSTYFKKCACGRILGRSELRKLA